MNSLLRFESTIKSEITKNNYKRSLDLFKKYICAKDYDSMTSFLSLVTEDCFWKRITEVSR